MKNFEGPIWFFKRHVSRSDGVSKRICSVSVRSTLNLNHSKLTYLAFAGLTNTVVKGKNNNISAIYLLIVQKISMWSYHIERSKVKEIEVLIKLRFSLFNMAATKF